MSFKQIIIYYEMNLKPINFVTLNNRIRLRNRFAGLTLKIIGALVFLRVTMHPTEGTPTLAHKTG